MEKNNNKNILNIITVIVVVVIWIAILSLEYGSSNIFGKQNNEFVNDYISDKKQVTNVNELEFVKDDLYKKYDDNYEWVIKDDLKDNLEVQVDDTSSIKIENSKLYILSNNSKNEVKTIYGDPKCVFGYGQQELEGIIVITENGTVWDMDITNDMELKDDFYQIDFEESVVDATACGEGNRNSEYYFLLSNGKLVNSDGVTYEEVNGNHILGLGYNNDEVYVGSDSTLSCYTDKIHYNIIKDADENNIIANKTYVQMSTNDNDLIKEHVLDRFFVVTKDNKLFYFDDPLQSKNIVAKLYEKTADKTVSKTEVESLEDRNDLVISFTDGTEIKIKDICDTYYDIDNINK